MILEDMARELARLGGRVARLESLEIGLSAGVAVYNSGAISIPDSTWTALTFDSERWDDEGFHSTVSNTSRLTVPAGWDGWYVIVGHARFASSGAGNWRMGRILLNGATEIAKYDKSPTAGADSVPASTEYYLSASDYVEYQVYQDSGGALNILAAGNHTPEFRMVRV